MTSNTIKGDLGPGTLVGIKRNMSMGQKTPEQLPTWQAKVSHMVPGEKQVQDPGEGVLWLFW